MSDSVKKIIAAGVDQPEFKKRTMAMGYTVPHNNLQGNCKVEIWEGEPMIIVITELPDNPGPSITNAIEHVCSTILRVFQIWDEPVLWIEHYPPVTPSDTRRSESIEAIEESFDLVTFTQIYMDREPHCQTPGWRRISREAVDQLIGAGRGGYDGTLKPDVEVEK